MDKSQNDPSNGLTRSKGCSAVAQDLASRLLKIENMLQTYDSKYAAFNTLLIKSINSCRVLHQSQLKFLTNCEELLPYIRKMESELAVIRWNVAKMEDRVAAIDRRQPNAKSKQKRRNLVNIIAKNRNLIVDYEEILMTKTAAIAVASEDYKSIKADMINIESHAFNVVHSLKLRRQQIIAERTELLAMKNALQDED